MNNNGFTLTELLITILLISLIAFIIISNVAGINHKQSETEYKKFIENVAKAACTYADLNIEGSNCSSNNNNECFVKISDLISEGLVDDNLINPNTKEPINQEDQVYVSKDNGKKTCTYTPGENNYGFKGPNISVKKYVGLYVFSINDPSGLNEYQISLNDVMNNPSKFKEGTDDIIYFEPRTVNTYYFHATDLFGTKTYKSGTNKTYSFTVSDEYIDREAPIIKNIIVKQGRITADIFDNVKVKGYKLSKLENINQSDYEIKFNGTLSKDDISFDDNNIQVSSESYVGIANETGTYYLHVIDYYNNSNKIELFVDFEKPTINATTNNCNLTVDMEDNYELGRIAILDDNSTPTDEDWNKINLNLSGKTSYTFNKTYTENALLHIYVEDKQGNLTQSNIYLNCNS